MNNTRLSNARNNTRLDNARLKALLCGFALVAALGMLALMADGAEADGRTKEFSGSGSGTSQIANPDECDLTKECVVELQGEFDAGEMGMGTARFKFTDDWSRVTGQPGSCSIAIADKSNFIWETTEGDALVMTPTLGFACPSQSGDFWSWKRALRIVEGTGKFDGVKGSVFISGSRTVETGEETWSFDGSITFPKEQRNGCFRAYFIGDLIVIPPREMLPPVTPSLSFWLCGDDVSLQGPNPRENYEIFNPIDPME